MRPLFDLDAVAAGARALCDGLLSGSAPYGCFHWQQQPLPNLLYLNDVVMLLWVIDELPAEPELRARWAATLNRFQYPEGGAYCYPPFATQSWQHATMNTVIALNMLGSRPTRPLTVLEPLRHVDTCRRWVESHADPHTAIPHHRYGLGAVLMHSSPPPPSGWADAFLGAIRRLQDPASGPVPERRRAPRHQRHVHVFEDHVERRPRAAPRRGDVRRAARRAASGRRLYRSRGPRLPTTWMPPSCSPTSPRATATGVPTPVPPCGVWPRASANCGGAMAHSGATPTRHSAILSLTGVLKRAVGGEVAGTTTCRFHFTDPTLLRAS